MKIFYCITSLGPSGGTERVLTTKMNYFSSLPNYEVYAILRNGNDSPFFSLSKKVKLIDFKEPNKKRYIKKLRDLVYAIKPDIVVSAGTEFHELPKFKDGSKKIYEFHYTKNYIINFVRGVRHLKFRYLHLLKAWLFQKNMQYTTRKYDQVVVLTKRDMELWGAPSNMRYIYDPLSFRSEQSCNHKSKVIVCVGSLTPAKGIDKLIDAFGIIAHKFTDWTLKIYGEGQDQKLIETLIKKYKIEDQVVLTGYTKNIEDKIREGSIYAFPSRSDGFGLVLTEAMECGLACVAFDCPCGPSEIIEEGKTGYLVPFGDINCFASRLEMLINDEDLRKRMGEEGRKQVKRFYMENIAPKWEALFSDLLSQ